MNERRPVYILDSFAVFAFLEDERGARKVETVLDSADRGEARIYLSWINLGEVLYIVERERSLLLAQKTLATVEQLPVEFLEATRERILAAAHIKAKAPISYADAFAVAAAQEFQATVLTGDPEFATVEETVSITWLPRR